MRKQFVAMIALLLTASIALSVEVSVQAESIEKDWTSWVNYAFKGTDEFYDKDVVAYKVGSTATLAVAVKNDLAPAMMMNVTVVGVSFDWQKPAAGWYNSTQASKNNPVRMETKETRYFIVNFTVPEITTAYAVVHDYSVYVEYRDTTGNWTWTATRESLFGVGKQYFVVYSAEQAQAKQRAQTIDGIVKLLGSPVVWSSAKAGLLWKRAMNETSIAEFHYSQGDFENAEKHYSFALTLIDLAFEAEETRGVRLEDAYIKTEEAEAKYFDALANFYNGFSNMWTLFGVALVLFAIGYIIRGFAMLRKPAVPT
jgi:tetratricopeptide (TPR) repeat protein